MEIKPGEIHTIMGPNGSGKSTLSKVIIGDPNYEVISGSIQYSNKNILTLEPEERSHLGIFLANQSPIEIPGVNNSDFLRSIYNYKQKYLGNKEMDPFDFEVLLDKKIKFLNLSDSYKKRNLNEGFSGGEKKKNEILQMSILEPKCIILDEIDSGLDIDALKVVTDAIKKVFTPDSCILLITHFPRILNYLNTNYVHILNKGKIIISGDKSLSKDLEEKGYEHFTKNI